MAKDVPLDPSSQINVTYVVLGLIRELQARHGSFSYHELARGVHERLQIPMPIALRGVKKVVAQMNKMIEHDRTDRYRFVEEPTPTIAETVAGWKTMMNTMKPKRTRK